MITQGTNPGGAVDRPRSRSLNLDHPTRPFHTANLTNPSRATFDDLEGSINSSTLCPENRGRYTETSNVARNPRARRRGACCAEQAP